MREHQNATNTRNALSEQSDRHARVRQLLESIEMNLAKIRAPPATGSAPVSKPAPTSVPPLPPQRPTSYALQLPAQGRPGQSSLPLPPPPVSHAASLPLPPQQVALPQLPRSSNTGTSWNPISLLPSSSAPHMGGRTIMGGATNVGARPPPWNDVLDTALNEGGKKTAASVSDVSGSEQEDAAAAANRRRTKTTANGTTNAVNAAANQQQAHQQPQQAPRTRSRALEATATVQ